MLSLFGLEEFLKNSLQTSPMAKGTITMVIEQDENISRTAVESNPGWVKVRNKKSNSYYYISFDGRQVSAREYKDLFEKYGSNIPASAVTGMTTPKAGFISNVGAATNPTEHPEHRTPPKPNQATDASRMEYVQQTAFKDDTEHPILDTVKEIAEKVPEPEKASNRSYGTNPSEKEIADGLTSAILFAAVIAAMFTGLESLAAWNKPMVDQATLPFIRIAKKHGWLTPAAAKVVAEGDDWAQLGKGLATLAIPVIMEVQFKHQQKMEEIRFKNQGAPVTNPPQSSPGNVRQNVANQNGHQQKADEATWMNPNVRPGGAPTPIIRYDNAG
jgi:hypothetical protein